MFSYLSGFGHDKSHAILPYSDLEHPPTLFFFGDGVSGMSSPILYKSSHHVLTFFGFADMYAARHANVLFVKEKDDGENDLAAYCNREGIKHIIFHDFSKALPVVQSVVKGDKTVEEVLAVGKA